MGRLSFEVVPGSSRDEVVGWLNRDGAVGNQGIRQFHNRLPLYDG